MTLPSGTFSGFFSDRDLPSLHQAVIENNKSLVRELLLHGAVDEVDFSGWTALHHAALLEDREIFDLLAANTPVQLQRTFNGGTATDLERLVGKGEQSCPKFWIEHETTVGTAANFEALTKAKLLAEISMTKEALYDEWRLGKVRAQNARELALDKFASPYYFAYLKRPPLLGIQKMEARGVDAGYGLVAGERIEKGAVVCEYLGEKVPLETAKNAYSFGPINGEKKRGLGGMIQDGFPNLFPLFLFRKRGAAIRIVFVALDAIEKGEVLTFNYGVSHPVKRGLRLELRPEALEKAFRGRSLLKMKEEVERRLSRPPLELGWKETLQLERHAASLQYLFQTPGVFEELAETGVVDRREGELLLKDLLFKERILLLPRRPQLYGTVNSK